MKPLFSAFLLVVLSLVCFSGIYAKTWHIKEDGTGDAPTIQAGIDSSIAGDSVLVASGTYNESLLIDGAHNGVSVLSVSGAGSTIIDAQLSGTVVDFAGVDISTILKGFTLTGGIGVSNPEHPGTFHGGGIRIFYCSPSIIENVITSNRVEDGRGGGIQCFGSSAIIENNVISSNYASFHGGGIHVEHGSPRITDNIIENNRTPGGGGAVAAYYSTIEMTDNILRKNVAEINGGAIVVDHCHVTISRNVVCDNYSYSIGGGAFLFACTGMLSHNTVAINRAGSSGGLAFLGGVAPTVTNNLVVCNVAQSVGGIGCDEATALDFQCNDTWNNFPDDYGIHCGDSTGTGGNISADPLFCDIYQSNYSLADGSPALIQECGVMGAVADFGCASTNVLSCEHPIAVEQRSWGSIKEMYK